MLQIGDFVQVLDNSEWHGKIRIVESFDRDGVPVLFCQSMQCGRRYWLHAWLRDKVQKFEPIYRINEN